MYPALYGEPLGEGVVECRLCAHYCRLAPGETGLCGVRHNRGGRLLTSSFGRPVLLGVEPIEKKYLFHAFPGTRALSLGTAGCNLGCRYCINWRVSQAGSDPATPEVAPADVVARALAAGARSIAFTYTEPTIFLEYAAEIARQARRHGLAVVAKSNGYMALSVLRDMASWLDAVNIDLKAWRDDRHRRLLGGDLAPVLENLRQARALGLWLEVATLVVPGCSDDPDDLAGMARFIAGELGPETPWHLLRFYPHYQMLDQPVTSETQLRRAVDAARSAGLCHVYTKELDRGRMLDTLCPGCQAVVIRRDGYRVAGTSLSGGRCAACGRPVPGVGMGEAAESGAASAGAR